MIDLNIKAIKKVCDETPNARCITKVTIGFQGDEIILQSGKYGGVSINGDLITLPFSNDKFYIKQVTSLFKLVRGFGFRILYDSAQRLYINLNPYYLNKVHQ